MTCSFVASIGELLSLTMVRPFNPEGTSGNPGRAASASRGKWMEFNSSWFPAIQIGAGRLLRVTTRITANGCALVALTHTHWDGHFRYRKVGNRLKANVSFPPKPAISGVSAFGPLQTLGGSLK